MVHPRTKRLQRNSRALAGISDHLPYLTIPMVPAQPLLIYRSFFNNDEVRSSVKNVRYCISATASTPETTPYAKQVHATFARESV